VLLGDRYGWQPLPAEIPAREFEHILARIIHEKSPTNIPRTAVK